MNGSIFDFYILEDVFAKASIMGVDWLITAMFAVVIMALITRSIGRWQILYLPILTLLVAIGMPGNPLLFTLAIIMFVTSSFAKQLLGDVMNVLKGTPDSKSSIKEAALDSFYGEGQLLKDKETGMVSKYRRGVTSRTGKLKDGTDIINNILHPFQSNNARKGFKTGQDYINESMSGYNANSNEDGTIRTVKAEIVEDPMDIARRAAYKYRYTGKDMLADKARLIEEKVKEIEEQTKRLSYTPRVRTR